jgi:hypothetical protein
MIAAPVTGRFMNRLLFTFVLSGFLSFSYLAQASAADVSLDHVEFSDGIASFDIDHISLSETNLSPDAARKLFSSSTSPEERRSMLDALSANKIVIPKLVVISPGEQIELSSLEADGVVAGKAAHMSVASASFNLRTRNAGRVEGRLRPSSGEGVLLSSLLRAAAEGRPTVVADRTDSSGFAGAIYAPVRANDEPTQNAWTVDLAGADSQNAYRDGVLVKGFSVVRNLTLVPQPGSSAAVFLEGLGYDALDVNIAVAVTYDPKAQTVFIDHLKLAFVGMGEITMTARFGGVPRATFEGGDFDRRSAFAKSDLLGLTLNVAEQGIFDKVLKWYAAQDQTSSDVVRRQWAATAAMTVMLLLRGSPDGLTLAQALSAFIQSPKVLKLTAAAKGAGLPLANLRSLGLAGILSALQLDAEAEK